MSDSTMKPQNALQLTNHRLENEKNNIIVTSIRVGRGVSMEGITGVCAGGGRGGAAETGAHLYFVIFWRSSSWIEDFIP